MTTLPPLVPPLKVDLQIYKGATYNPIFNWQDFTGKNINITGYTAQLQMRTSVNSTKIIANLTDGNDGLILGGAAGTIQINMTPAMTLAIAETAAVYDLVLTSTIYKYTLVNGNIIFIPGVTQ